MTTFIVCYIVDITKFMSTKRYQVLQGLWSICQVMIIVFLLVEHICYCCTLNARDIEIGQWGKNKFAEIFQGKSQLF